MTSRTRTPPPAPAPAPSPSPKADKRSSEIASSSAAPYSPADSMNGQSWIGILNWWRRREPQSSMKGKTSSWPRRTRAFSSTGRKGPSNGELRSTMLAEGGWNEQFDQEELVKLQKVQKDIEDLLDRHYESQLRRWPYQARAPLEWPKGTTISLSPFLRHHPGRATHQKLSLSLL